MTLGEQMPENRGNDDFICTYIAKGAIKLDNSHLSECVRDQPVTNSTHVKAREIIE